MGKFINGLLIGVGIGLVTAPRPGQETRQLLLERFGQLRGNLPATLQQNLSGDQVKRAARKNVSRTEAQLKKVAEQAEQHPMLHTPPAPTYEPAYPEYVNPEKNSDY